MRTKETKETKNLQVLRGHLANRTLAKLVKEAEKGPFMIFKEHHQKMDTRKLQMLVAVGY